MTLPAARTSVVAVGGNALTQAHEQGSWQQIEANAAVVADTLALLAGRVAVVHGNGPQVGALSLQQDAAQQHVPVQPLHQLGAMTQGQLGGVLARALDRRLGRGAAVAVVTHVVVDPEDPAFDRPSKPIGPFLSRARAHRLAAERGWQVVEDAGRGWRRVVASPAPLRIVEGEAVRVLLDAGHVVLAAGGGGVPVTPDLAGVDAVVDKDAAAARLAVGLGAQDLLLVTGVDAVRLDFGTPAERRVGELDAGEAARHLAAGQFPPGSMGPKIEAALQFLAGGGERVLITAPGRLAAALAGDPDAGTWVRPEAARQPSLR